MTILHVIPFLWSGAGRVVTRLCLEQSRRHDVHLVTTGCGHGSRDWPAYVRGLRSAGVAMHRVDTYARDGATFWPAVARLAALIEGVRPTLVHAHAGTPTAAVALARAGMSRAVPLVAHMYSWGQGRPSWMDTMDLWAFSRAERVICSAHAYARVLRAGGVLRRRLAYVPWGVDLPPDAPSRRRSGEPHVPVRLGFIGRLEPRKGQLLLADAVRVLAARRKVCLELAGPPADEAYARALRDRAAERPDVISLLGRVPRVGPVLARWDLLVSLSSDEGQGLAILEAMAAGVPVAALRVAGVEDYLRDGRTGTELAAGPASAIAEQIATALADRDRLTRMAGRARALVTRRYAWDRTFASLERVYAEALALRPPASAGTSIRAAISRTKRSQVKKAR